MRKLSESDISKQIKGFLECHGWRSVRMQRTVLPGTFQTGEPGMPDFLFLQYLKNGAGLVLWIEMKRPGAPRVCRCAELAGTRRRCTACDQREWKKREEIRGGRVWRVDNLDHFETKYWELYGWLHTGPTGRGQLSLGAI